MYTLMGLLRIFVIILMLSVGLFGCSRNSEIIPEESGLNRENLIAVLDFYKMSCDSLKLEAAKFLIRNMRGHTSMEEDFIFPDAALLSDTFLITHIDHAFEQWQTSPFAKDLTFEEFSEYLLPYRAIQGVGYNISGKERYRWIVEHCGNIDTITDLRELIDYYNKSIISLRKKGGKRYANSHDGLNDLLYEDFTNCIDVANQTCLNLRSLGIPCVVEHNLGYRTLKSFHYHCAAWDDSRQVWIKFNGEEKNDYPGDGDWTSPELMNIYRETYTPQRTIPLRHSEFMPRGFENPFMVDVTENIVSVTIRPDTFFYSQTPYLATFHRSNRGLDPFTFGRIVNDELIFENVVPSVWYIVAFYNKGVQKIASRPFKVERTQDGKGLVEYVDFEGSQNQIEDIVVKRKYPEKKRLKERAATLIGTVVEGANNSDYSDAKVLWRLENLPSPRVCRYDFRLTGNYRYYRLIPPGACEVSVLEWITDKGIITFSDSANLAYDGNMTTAPKDSSQITLVLSEPHRVVGINMAPVNADNGICKGDLYCLYYWNNHHGWQLHSRQPATSDSILFKGVPKGALLWLKNLSHGQEEMPFYFSNGEQIFIY